jgi:membrane protein YqaA with SNARE-associated domain
MTETNKRGKWYWIKLGAVIFLFFAFSVGFAYLAQLILSHYQIPFDVPLWTALLIVLGVLVLINLSALPLPFGLSLMLVAANHWNPALVALAGSIGASFGEFSSYFFGYLGKRVAINDNTPGYKMIQGWIHRWGMWAIAFLSFQPVIPFEIGGLIAGIVRMPIRKFLPAIMIGKFPKYLIFIYLGHSLLHRFFA